MAVLITITHVVINKVPAIPLVIIIMTVTIVIITKTIIIVAIWLNEVCNDPIRASGPIWQGYSQGAARTH